MGSPHVAGQGRLGLTCITSQGGPASATCYGSTPVGLGTCRRSRLAGPALRVTAGCAQHMIQVKARPATHVAGQDRSGAHVTLAGPLDQAHVAGHGRVALTHITSQGRLGPAHAMGQGRLGPADGPGLSGLGPSGQGRNRLILQARAGPAHATCQGRLGRARYGSRGLWLNAGPAHVTEQKALLGTSCRSATCDGPGLDGCRLGLAVKAARPRHVTSRAALPST